MKGYFYTFPSRVIPPMEVIATNNGKKICTILCLTPQQTSLIQVIDLIQQHINKRSKIPLTIIMISRNNFDFSLGLNKDTLNLLEVWGPSREYSLFKLSNQLTINPIILEIVAVLSIGKWNTIDYGNDPFRDYPAKLIKKHNFPSLTAKMRDNRALSPTSSSIPNRIQTSEREREGRGSMLSKMSDEMNPIIFLEKDEAIGELATN